MASGTTASRVETAGVGGIARGIFAAAIVLAALLAGWHAFRIAGAADAASGFELALAVLLGMLAADLLTGTVHWTCDTWGDEHSGRLGSGLIRSFREHHRRPRAMVEHDWIEVNGEAAAAAAGAFALLALDGPATALLEWPAAYGFAWSTIAFSALTNQIHQWAHRSDPPRLVGRLQRAGILLSLRRHACHHRAHCTLRYCITTGWLNPLLDRIGFWRALERGITRATGATPRGEVRPDAPRSRVVRRDEATRLPSRSLEEEA